MSLAQISYVPLNAGFQGFVSVLKGGWWLFVRFINAPVSASLLIVMLAGSAATIVNALYLQDGLRTPQTIVEKLAAAPEPVVPRPAAVRKIEPAPAVVAATPAAKEAVAEVPAVLEVPSVPATVSGNEDVFNVQGKLARMGLFSGAIDGYYGPQTAEAIRAFEKKNNMPLVGAMSPEVVAAVAAAKVGADSTASITNDRPATAQPDQAIPAPLAKDPLAEIARRATANLAEEPEKPVAARSPEAPLVEKIQKGLARLGFLQAAVDGVPGEATAKAIRNFEVYYNYKVTGEISPELVDLLTAAGGL